MNLSDTKASVSLLAICDEQSHSVMNFTVLWCIIQLFYEYTRSIQWWTHQFCYGYLSSVIDIYLLWTHHHPSQYEWIANLNSNVWPFICLLNLYTMYFSTFSVHLFECHWKCQLYYKLERVWLTWNQKNYSTLLLMESMIRIWKVKG